MVAPATQVGVGLQSLCIEKEIFIAAPLDIAFESLLEELGPESVKLGSEPMPMVLEAWPGGRWFRDLGKDGGHFWGHVQVIKPPKLLELSGPLFMSFPAVNHVQYKLEAEGIGTRIKLVHRGFGEIPAEMRDGVNLGWAYKLQRAQQIAEARVKAKS
jgi:hypothetical protein